MQGSQKELDPGIPVGLGAADRSLRAPKRDVIAFLGLLDDAFERAVGDVSVAGPQEQQGGQNTR
ncbi:hypothetical protein D3C72_2230960 [compost metagenome]